MAFLFAFAVWLVTIALASLALLPAHPGWFTTVSVLLTVVYLAVFVRPSFQLGLVRRQGVRLVSFYLGTFDKTFVTGTDQADLQSRYPVATQAQDLLFYLGRGMQWVGLPDVVYLQWPFYSVTVVTTAQLRIPIDVSDGVWTAEQVLYRLVKVTRTVKKKTVGRGNKQKEIARVTGETREEGDWTTERPHNADGSLVPMRSFVTTQTGVPGDPSETTTEVMVETQTIPRIQLRVNGEVFIRFGVNLGRLILALPDAPLSRPDGAEGLEAYLGEKIQPLIHEAIREGVAGFQRKHYQDDGTISHLESVPGLPWEGLMDVVQARGELEKRVREILGSQAESVLRQSGLIRDWDGHTETTDRGPSAAAFDLVIEHIAPADDELLKVISSVAVARKQAEAAEFEGLATERRERGVTNALDERGRRLHNVTGKDVLAHHFGVNTKANLTFIEPGLVEALALFGRRQQARTNTPP